MARTFLKKWILLFVVIFFNLAIALRTSVEFFYIFFWFLVFIVAISLAWVAAEYFAIKLILERRTSSRIEEDDILAIEAVIKNKGFLPCFNIVLKDYLPCAISGKKQEFILLEFLGPKEALSLKYNCCCPQRGKYKIGPFEAYLFDPFGIFFLKKTYHIYSEIYVYPQTFQIKKFPALTKGTAPWFGIETSRVSGDEHEFYGVREYKPGDPIKRIHWFSTARRNSLIVKQFQRQSFFRATILFNLEKDKNYGQGKESVVEYAIKIAASVAKHLIERGVSVEVIAHVGEMVHIHFNKGPEHLEDILRFLAVATAESRVNFSEIFQEFYMHIPSDSSLIVIMPDTDWGCLPAMLSLERKNVSIMPLILMSASFLSASREQENIKDARAKFPQAFDFNPIFFSCGDNLGEAFVRY